MPIKTNSWVSIVCYNKMLLLFITAVLIHDARVERDLQLCEHIHLDGNTTSKYHRTIQKYSHILREFIPHTFLPQFRNPCWYSHFPYTVKSKTCERIRLNVPILGHSKESRHTDHLYCLPAFFLAGFSKCATSTLFDMIIQHPDIAPPKCKEGQFWSAFAKNDGNREYKMKQIGWYLSHFSLPVKAIQSQPQAITFDGSTQTIWNYSPKQRKGPDSEICLVPSMIKRVLPNAKFIVIMRDPAKRLFSNYWYSCSNSIKWKSKKDPVGYYSVIAQHMFHNITKHVIYLFQSCVKSGTSRFTCVQKVSDVDDFSGCAHLRLGIGMYYYHIIPWLSVFPRENFLFLKTEELVSRPDVEMKKVWAFLGLQNMPKIEPKFSNSNKWIIDTKYKTKFAMLPETKQILDRFYQPHSKLLAHLLSDSKYQWSEVP